MLRMFARSSIVLPLFALMSAPAKATPNCLRDNQAYKLVGDTIEWSMTIAPGADCIQGLRWSTMQIYSVSIAEKPRAANWFWLGQGFDILPSRISPGPTVLPSLSLERTDTTKAVRLFKSLFLVKQCNWLQLRKPAFISNSGL